MAGATAIPVPVRLDPVLAKTTIPRICRSGHLLFLSGISVFLIQYFRLYFRIGKTTSFDHVTDQTVGFDLPILSDANSQLEEDTTSNIFSDFTSNSERPQLDESDTRILDDEEISTDDTLDVSVMGSNGNVTSTMSTISVSPEGSFSRFSAFPTLKELQSSCPPRLEFLHIPKTGGTVIEQVAYLQANIAWGCCHFHINYKKAWTSLCPKHLAINETLWPKHQKLNDLWHYPLDWLERNRTLYYHPMPSNPYHNLALSNQTMSSSYNRPAQKSSFCLPHEQEVHYFAIVRDPYSRAISEFYFQAGFAAKKNQQKLQEPKFLNRWIGKKLTEYDQVKKDSSKSWNGKMLHWIPQAEYIFDTNGVRRVHHVLKFENLHEEFHSLMKAYGLDLHLPEDRRLKSGSVQAQHRLQAKDLSANLRALLERHFANDFMLGNYAIIGAHGKRLNDTSIL